MFAGQAIAVKVEGDPTSSNNGIFYFHNDHLGSTSVLTRDSNGYVLSTSVVRYLPFGGYRDTGTQEITDKGYTGHKENLDIGLIYMNARFYVPGLMRFASADTIVPNPANPQSFNRYSYVLNSPLNFTDPSGHIPCDSSNLPGIDQGACFNDQDEYSTYYPTQSSTASYIVGAGHSENAIPAELAHLDNLDVWGRFFRNVTGFISEPLDWILNGREIASGDVSGEVAASMIFLAALPGAQGSWGDEAADGVRLLSAQNWRNGDIFFKNFQEGSGFSGVFDPNTGHFIVRPSGDTLLMDGTVPSELVPRGGGHGIINRQLAEQGIDPSQTVGFTVFYDGPEQLSVAWNSGSVNVGNHGSSVAPTEYRQTIMNILREATGYTVTTR